MPFAYTFRADDLESIKPEDRDLLENRDRELEAYLTQPTLKIRRVATQSFAGGTASYVTWDTEDVDSNGFISVSSDTITIPGGATGVYAIGYTLSLNSAPSSPALFQIEINGVLVGSTQEALYGATFISGTTMYLVAGNTIKTSLNPGGSTRTVTGTLWMTRVMA